MADKKYSSKSEENIRFRSRPPKPFYKKLWVWTIVLLSVIIGIYIFGSKNDIVDEPENLGVRKEDNKEKIEKKESEIEEIEEEIIEENKYTYEDFKGTYVSFEGEPYNSAIVGMSEIMVLGDNHYRSFDRWEFDMTSTIIDKTIKGNLLTLEVDSDENEVWGLHSEKGKEEFEIHHEGDKKVLYSIEQNASLYSMSDQDLQDHYSQLEIDYARILMSIHGEPSLDQWAVWNDEWGVPVIDVSYNVAGDPTEVSDKVAYPEDVTHLSLTRQGMAAGITTYSTQGDGYIKIYPMPLHYHQEDQSDEGYMELAQEALNGAYTIYVEPFEPYTVADFIGHVEFVYQ